jgi:3-oxoadipate enol-lactonase
MDELGLGRAHICGLSLGGVVAIAMHHAAPSRCISLTLADTFAAHPQGSQVYERSIAGSSDLRAMAEARVDVLLAQPADPGIRREVVETMARIDPSAYRIGAEAVWLADQRERARQIDVPTLILVGREDLVTPLELSNELAELVHGSTIQVIEGAGHISNLEKPPEFNSALETFIDMVEAGQR